MTHIQPPVQISTWMSNKHFKLNLSKIILMIFLSRYAPFLAFPISIVVKLSDPSSCSGQSTYLSPIWFSLFSPTLYMIYQDILLVLALK